MTDGSPAGAGNGAASGAGNAAASGAGNGAASGAGNAASRRTAATILKTPKGWPSILLDVAQGDAAFAGLRRAIRELGPTGTIAEIAASGLRGRGGSGYATADKWRAAAAAGRELGPAATRYVVINGYGADPSSLTDRTLLTANPVAVVEGAAIAAWAIGAGEASIAVRAGETAAIAALREAIAAGHEAGLLGEAIAGTSRRLEVEIRTVQGAYMLGEETVLLKALEGKRGQPDQRPPHPSEDGLWGRPTVVQNAQTAAAAAWILGHSAEAFRAGGTADAPGTILVDVRGPAGGGIAEVPFGATLGEIAALAGARGKGGADAGAGRPVKAVLVGGPSGGILPADRLSTPYTFEALRAVGAHVGSGSVIVADDRACVVDLARVLTRFCADEACGKTIPCRIGTRRIAEIGERLAGGTSRAGDLDLLVTLSDDIVGSALCDHERLATLPLTTGLRYFGPEVEAHLEQGVCPAGVCRPIALGRPTSVASTASSPA